MLTLQNGAQVAVQPDRLTGDETDVELLAAAVGVSTANVKPQDATALPHDVVQGTCGSSYFWIEDAGILDIWVTLGFEVDSLAVGYTASYIVYGPGDWTGTNYYSGGLANRARWDGFGDHDVPGIGLYEGWAQLDATLWWGGICSSEGPSDTEYVT